MGFVEKCAMEVKAGEINKYVHIVEAFQTPMYRLQPYAGKPARGGGCGAGHFGQSVRKNRHV